MANDRIYSRGLSSDESDLVIQWESAQPWHSTEDDNGRGYVLISLHRRNAKGKDELGDAEDEVVGYGHFDRPALNRLIEKARRARNQAYGEDK